MKSSFEAAGPRIEISHNFLFLVTAFLVSGGVLYKGWMAPSFMAFAFVASGWMISLCLHEGGHALAAFYGGDKSVVANRYLTLDPLAYAHPLLSFGLPMVFLLLGGIGLPGGAVYINHAALRSRNWDSFVSAAGPLANLICLVVLSIPFWFGFPYSDTANEAFWGALAFLIALQVSALVLNLLPIPGLDGFGIIRPHLSYDMQNQTAQLAPMIGFPIMMLIFMSDTGSRTIWRTVFWLTEVFNVDAGYVFIGITLFRFWK